MKKKKLRVLELFAGIGSCSYSLRKCGFEVEIVDAVEIDEKAINSFNIIHNTNFKAQDICKWDKKVKDIDLLMHGSPCQDFSIMGKGKGGDKGSGTRSSLLYESIRIIKKVKPKVVIWENVKALTFRKHVHNLKNYINELDKMGYTTVYKVLNAKDYCIPQNRSRIFVVSILGSKKFKFPKAKSLTLTIFDFLSKDKIVKEENSSAFISDSMKSYWLKEAMRANPKSFFYPFKLNREVASTILTQQVISPSVQTFISQTVKKKNVIINTKKKVNKCYSLKDLRRFSARESLRLMGFDSKEYDKLRAKNVSNISICKQAGNSIVTNCLIAIFKCMVNQKIL